MITLKLKAGLGNQLFQYSYARALAIKSNTKLIIDTSWYSNISSKDTKRECALEVYTLSPDVSFSNTNEKPFSKFIRKIHQKISRLFFKYSDYVYYSKEARPVKKDITVEGYWNTERYFKEIESSIRNELRLKQELSAQGQLALEKIRELSKEHTVLLIHVRRGDYVTNQFANVHHGCTSIAYYTEAIKTMLSKLDRVQIQSKPPYYVLASDDVEWTRQNISPLLAEAPYLVLSDEYHMPDYEELYVMSQCEHFIIANSTYSWWAAWLSESAHKNGVEKIVIGPKQWTANLNIDTRDVLPLEWVRI